MKSYGRSSTTVDFPQSFDTKTIDALQVLGRKIYDACTNPKNDENPDAKKKKTKRDKDDNSSKMLLAHRVRILSPILPSDILDQVTTRLCTFGATLFDELFKTFGTTANDSKTRLELRRMDSHVSADSKVWRRDERRGKHISEVKELLDVLTRETTFSDIVNQSILLERLWFKLPKTHDASKEADVDALLSLIEQIDKERSTLSKMGTTVREENEKSYAVSEVLSSFLERRPILTPILAERLSAKWPEQTGNVLKSSPLRKQDAPAPNADILLFLAYTSQHEPRISQSAANQRKKTTKQSAKLAGYALWILSWRRLKLSAYDCSMPTNRY